MKKRKVLLVTGVLVVFSIIVIGSLLSGYYEGVLKPASFNDYIVPVSGDSTGYYRHCYEELNDEEKKLYSIILQDIYSQPETIEVPELVNGDLKKVFKALSYDNPDLFNMGLNCRIFQKGQKHFFEVEYDVEYESYKKQLEESKAIADVIIQGASQFTDDYEKEKYVHDYLISHCTYINPEDSVNSSTMYGCLVEGKASCEGYSRAFQYILNNLDIDNRLITGDAADDGVNYVAHMWNFVCVNDNWYFVDVTWDDPKGDSSILSHTYFNVDTEDILKEHRNIEQNIPFCTAEYDNYFVRENTYILTGSGENFETAVSNAVFAAVYNNQNSVELRFPSGAVMEQAKNSLFSSGVIYDSYKDAGLVEADVDSVSVNYIPDNTMCVLHIFF